MIFLVDGAVTYAATGGRPFDPELPVVVFIHGAAMDHGCWSAQTRYFAHHGRAVLALDLPGHGRSAGRPPGSVADYAAWVHAALDHFGIARAALVGHSLGSLIALEAAAQRPERIWALGLLAVAYPMRVNADFLALARDRTGAAIELMMDWSYGRDSHIGGSRSPGLWQIGVGRRLVQRAPAGLLHHDLSAAMGYDGGLAAAARITCPVSLLLGEGDAMTPPRAARDLGRAFAQCDTTIIPGCGHMLMNERPAETLDALRELV
jgi:pimeloyl-ACP methyl ester carboxylesterase